MLIALPVIRDWIYSVFKCFWNNSCDFSWLVIIGSHKETAIRMEETDLLMKHKPASYLTPSHSLLCWLCTAKRSNMHQELCTVICIGLNRNYTLFKIYRSQQQISSCGVGLKNGTVQQERDFRDNHFPR